MPTAPTVVRTLPSLRRALERLRARRATIALVPTMGALHEGHLALVRQAKRRASKVVVSIFVNPTQFAPHEDFGSYPRTWKADMAKLAEAKVDLVWHPDVSTMYPQGFATRISTEGPAMAGLEDRFRPHFFGGVTTVVGKLFIQCRPDLALFGQKDYQQLFRALAEEVTSTYVLAFYPAEEKRRDGQFHQLKVQGPNGLTVRQSRPGYQAQR